MKRRRRNPAPFMESKMEYAIARVFAKRETEKSKWNGRIGSVEGKAEIGSFVINGKELPQASVDYLLHFALQSLQDAYAGAESMDEAVGAWEKKLAALIEGTIGVRGEGGMTDEERAELYVAEAIYATVHKKGSEKGDAFRALKGDDKTEFLVANVVPKVREQVADFADRVAARVAHVVEMRKRRAAEKNEFAGMGGLDL